MIESTQFQVYNASAGSGKTFTLVKEYLKILLDTDDIFRFQNILAITFTNKAAAEMKERVLKNLRDFSEGKHGDLFEKIKQECNLSEDKIKARSKRVINSILQNYSAFNITTIDSFTHRIVRSFAFDLGLSLNFEVEMDAKVIIDEAVDLLISKIGSEQQLTKTLIDFSLDKAADDKAWDIANDLKDFAKILLNENDVNQLEKLEKKSIQDFTDLKNHIKKTQNKIESQFKEIGNKAIDIVESNNLEKGIYKGNYFLKHFINLKNDFSKAKFFDQTTLKANIENKTIYNKGAVDFQGAIDEVEPVLEKLYIESEALYQQHLLNSLVLKSLIPLAVLKHINSSLNEIKEDNNIRLNAEFNRLISEQIKNEPAPFIYERIGEKFRYYFIDEMQDTSQLQCQNLIPLIENALTSETIDKGRGSLMLVGDAKQAIYRWRGGKAEQFIDLANDENPFSIPKYLQNLDTNYRSYSEIIDFNNQFFTHVSDFLGNSAYKDLYLTGNQQKKNKRVGGYVKILFVEKPQDKDEKELVFPEKVYEILQNLDSGFDLREVCILVRKKKEGIAVADYLTEHNINIVSSETLLLKSNENIDFILNILTYLQFPNHKEAATNALYFLCNRFDLKEDVHLFVSEIINKNPNEFLKSLYDYGFYFDENEFLQLPFYDAIEYLIRNFKLIDGSDAFVQAFLDVILEFQNKRGSSLLDFLEYWDRKNEGLSIAIPEIKNAVKIMTIHKAKGLEFPVVIYPYDLDIYREINPKVWYNKLDKEKFLGFESTLVDYSKRVVYASEYGEQLFKKRRQEVQLDNLNLLYVALTRPVEQLYIISETHKKINELSEAKKYSDFFVDFLQSKNEGGWVNEDEVYSIGNSKRNKERENDKKDLESIHQEKFISSSWKNKNINIVSKSSLLWDTEREQAIDYGNLIHEILSEIKTIDDVEFTLQNYISEGIITQGKSVEIKAKVYGIINHPDLTRYYQSDLEIFNEQELLTNEKQIQIPDRIVLENKLATIIDYKTGEPNKKYHLQLNNYAKPLAEIGFNISKMYLVFVNNKITVEEVLKS
ncbi:MAG: UvrD-helicase domain-containing protein [Urechidicola sp.]|nr:UvrD-helicase domain-containing protein [Urechidicola sp.]